MKLKPKRYQDEHEIKKRKEKLKQLTELYGLPDYMGEIFLSELKLTNSQHPEDLKAIERAKLLGLL